MKKLFTLLFVLLLINALTAHAQVFWTENFESGASPGLSVSSYVSPNGAWTMTTAVSSAEGDAPNTWYVSCQEAGQLAGVCGNTCAASFGLGATLHIGADAVSSTGDNGASYDAGGLPCAFGIYCVESDRRAQSPTINCTGKSNIRLRFYYIENGDAATDDGTVWYSPDNGASWAILVNPPKTALCSSSQGKWDTLSVMLPPSANNNPTVKIGFRWVNNDDGSGVDPSFAVDSVSLRVSSAAALPTASFTVAPNDTVCADSCIILNSTSTGTVDSIKWAIAPSVTLSSTTANPLTVCFGTSAAYTVTLTAYGGGGNTNSVQSMYIKPKPGPTIAKSGHTLTVPTGYTSYQWYNGTTPIAGATNNTYTYTGTGNFSVVVDSGSCKGTSKNNINTAGIPQVSSAENTFWTSRGNNGFTIWSKDLLKESIYISIYDAAGRRIVQDQWSEGSDMKVFGDLSLVPGLYIIRLNDNTGNSVSLKYME